MYESMLGQGQDIVVDITAGDEQKLLAEYNIACAELRAAADTAEWVSQYPNNNRLTQIALRISSSADKKRAEIKIHDYDEQQISVIREKQRSYSLSDSDFSIESKMEEKGVSTEGFYKKILRYGLFAPSVCKSLTDSIELSNGINKLVKGSAKLFYSIPISNDGGLALLIGLPTFYFAKQLQLHSIHTASNINAAIKILRTRRLPQETPQQIRSWPVLGEKQEYIAMAIGSVFIIMPAFFSAISAHYFGANLPEIYDLNPNIFWDAFAIVLAVSEAMSVTLCEGISTYKVTRKFFSANAMEYFRNIKLRDLLFSYPLGFLNAIAEGLQHYVPAGMLFGINGADRKWGLLATTVVTCGIPDFCLNGRITIEALQKLKRKLRTGVTKGEIAASVATAIVALGIAQSMQKLMYSFLDSNEMPLPLELNEEFKIIFSFIFALRKFINTQFMLYKFFNNTLPKAALSVTSSLSKSCMRVYGFFRPAALSDDSPDAALLNSNNLHNYASTQAANLP